MILRRGMGQAGCATAVCNDVADDGSCIEWDDSSCTTPQANYTQPVNLSGGNSTIDPLTGLPYFTNPGGNVSIPLNTPLTPAQAGLTAAQQAQLIAAVGNSTVSLIRTAAGGPYQIAGTNNDL